MSWQFILMKTENSDIDFQVDYLSRTRFVAFRIFIYEIVAILSVALLTISVKL